MNDDDHRPRLNTTPLDTVPSDDQGILLDTVHSDDIQLDTIPSDSSSNSSSGPNPKPDLEHGPVQPPHIPSWSGRLQRHSSRVPFLNKVFLYLRGPRPKLDLPDPKPLLDIDIRIRGRHIVAPIETTFLRFTRLLPNPWLFTILAAGYIISFAFFARAQFFQTPVESFISCNAALWAANAQCGLDGSGCSYNGSLDFRCPAQCSGVILQNPRAVGDQRPAFVPLIVGGGDSDATYRGDSFICAAAIQAGVISNSRGGCGTLDVVGNYTNFESTTAHGLTSIGFPTVFPSSYRFRSTTALTHCEDMRDDALAFNALVTALLFLVLRPKPIVLFWCLVCIGFWHVVLFSQPQGPPPPLDTAFGTFLPALFICYAAPIEATILYLAPYWRLTSSDLTKRSGAITTLVVILIFILVVALNQLRVFRKTGWLPYYLAWYIAGGLVALVLALLPGLNLRIHHYFLAIILMPGTGLPTRISAMAQGYLLGLFLNGAAAYGFDSILQTKADLVQDATIGSDLASFVTNSTNYNASIPMSNQTIFWNAHPDGWDGFSLLVDDVERYVGDALNLSLAAFDSALPHFFRLALTSGGNIGDFTRAATLFPNGTWVDAPPGAT
ncbi:LCCL domain-containing protein [Mycena kentingensis (nom. inval.)]|nr:LCCL domain-containing protein [Mycena kentingensis (nom. inval.)]